MANTAVDRHDLATSGHSGGGAQIGGTGPTPLPRIARRHALPSTRAMVGALFITLAAVGTFAVASGRGGPQGTSYAIASRSIAPGARLDAGALTTRTLTLDPDVAATAFRDPQRLVGAVALGPIGAGQLISTAGVALPFTVDGTNLVGHEFSFPVARDRVPPSLRRGEQVAVLATYGTGAEARTVTTVQGATVVAFDADGDVVGTRTEARLTLLLPDAQNVVETAHASQVAELTIVRTTQAGSALPASYRPATTAAR